MSGCHCVCVWEGGSCCFCWPHRLPLTLTFLFMYSRDYCKGNRILQILVLCSRRRSDEWEAGSNCRSIAALLTCFIAENAHEGWGEKKPVNRYQKEKSEEREEEYLQWPGSTVSLEASMCTASTKFLHSAPQLSCWGSSSLQVVWMEEGMKAEAWGDRVLHWITLTPCCQQPPLLFLSLFSHSLPGLFSWQRLFIVSGCIHGAVA